MMNAIPAASNWVDRRRAQLVRGIEAEGESDSEVEWVGEVSPGEDQVGTSCWTNCNGSCIRR